MKNYYSEAVRLQNKRHYAEARRLYQLGAKAGDPLCAFGVALCLDQGWAVEKDEARAAEAFAAVFEPIRALAQSENTEAQWTLGLMYRFGKGVETDFAEAVKWYRLSAEQGDSVGQWRLGYMYQFGEGVETDFAEAVKWYRLAAEQGNSASQWRLGYMYEFGEGVEEDFAEAVKWYRLAAEGENSMGRWRLGYMYQFGKGVETDFAEAVKWYRLSAEQGNSTGQWRLGTMYRFGQGVEQDLAEAVKWYRLSAEQEDSIGQWRLGSMYQFGTGVKKDFAKAVKWYRLSAEQRDADGQFRLGRMYRLGLGVKQDFSKALKWVRLSAEQGDQDGQCYLGSMYENGQGVEQDLAEAVKWYRLAAEQDDSASQWKLGSMYENGQGVEQDLTEAVKWYRLAAENGDGGAQCRMGTLYEQGLGVEKNPAQAVDYWKAAAENRHPSGEACYKLGFAYYDGYVVDKDLNKAKDYFEKAQRQNYACGFILETVNAKLGLHKKENVMRACADSFAKKGWIKKDLYQHVHADLETDFGETWAQMDDKSQNFLKTGMISYISLFAMGEEVARGVDFSCAILPMFKAMETELGKYFCTAYVEFLKTNHVPFSCFREKKEFIRAEGAYTFAYRDSDSITEFTLGGFARWIGLKTFSGSDGKKKISFTDKDGHTQTMLIHENREQTEHSIDPPMLDFAKTLFRKNAFGSDREIINYLANLAQGITDLQRPGERYFSDLRNHAAHTERMEREEAEACGNYIIKTQKVLRTFIEKLEPDAVKQYLNRSVD